MFDLILIDFSWLYNRYFFIAKSKPLCTNPSKEELATEVRRMLFQFLTLAGKSYPSAKVMLTLDPPTSSLENFKLNENYKQNRDKEAKKEVYAIIKDVVLSLADSLDNKFSFVRALGYEADQVIAYICNKFHEDYQVLIYSGDKDLLQLSALTNVYISDKYEKGSFILKTNKDIFEKFKNSKGEDFTRISTNKRDILKYRTLKGDSSDNLPPVFPRIKDKEIVSIIKDYWISEDTLSMERINDIIDDIRGDNVALANKLEEAKDTWLTNYKIMNLYGLEGIKIKKIRRG